MHTNDQAAGEGSGFGLRSYLHGLGAIGLLIALVVATPAALIVGTGRICACTQPPDLVVQNADARPVTVTWRREGVWGPATAGDAGTTFVEACGSMDTTLPQGRVHVVVTSASETQEFDLDIPQRFASSPFGWRVVREGGAIVDAGWGGPADDPLVACVSGAAATD